MFGFTFERIKSDSEKLKNYFVCMFRESWLEFTLPQELILTWNFVHVWSYGGVTVGLPELRWTAMILHKLMFSFAVKKNDFKWIDSVKMILVKSELKVKLFMFG